MIALGRARILSAASSGGVRALPAAARAAVLERNGAATLASGEFLAALSCPVSTRCSSAAAGISVTATSRQTDCPGLVVVDHRPRQRARRRRHLLRGFYQGLEDDA